MKLLMERRQRNTAVFAGAVLAGGLFFGLHGWMVLESDVVYFRFPSMGTYHTNFGTVVALVLLMTLAAAPAGWLKRLLRPVGRFPVLAPAALLTVTGACVVYEVFPLWDYFAGAALVAGAVCYMLRREACSAADRALAWCGQARAFPLLLAAATAAATFVVNRVLYDGQPHVIDSWARYAHVLMLSQGHWCFPAPPDWQWTVQFGMVNDGTRYASQYQPGCLLIGLAGYELGSLAVLPALLAGGTVLLTYAAGRRLMGAQTAALGAILLTLSTNFLFLAASFMEHTPATFFLMLSLWLGLRDLERPRVGQAAVLGLAVGYACITRSLTSLGWAGPLLAVWAVMRWRRWSWRGVPSWGCALAGWMVPVAFLLYFNSQITGNPFRPAYLVATPQMSTLGFTATNSHTPLRGLVYQLNNLWALSEWLFCWPATSYIFVYALFLFGRWERRDTLMLLPLLGLVACYFFYPYQDFGFSPRYLSEAIPLLALLTARGIMAGSDYLRRSAPEGVPGVWPRLVLALLILLFAVAVPAAYPKFAKERLDQRCGVEALGDALAPFHSMPDATVFLDGHLYAHRAVLDEVQCWGGARFLQAPSAAERARYVREHPERRCFLVNILNRTFVLAPE